MRQSIPIYQFNYSPFSLWDREWFLLTSGDFQPGKYNCMTISWGSMGIMWNKPFVQVVVRPERYTFSFMESSNEFTLSHFPSEFRPALQILGSQSGRDGDKIQAAGLTPTASETVSAPTYAEADLVIECRKIFSDDFDPDHFLAGEILSQYPENDFHRQYFGEILSISGSSEFVKMS